jgi:hypothetical protein
MSQCAMNFQSIPLHIMYSSQHFELIQYVNSLSRSLLAFQINDPKNTIDLNDFPSFSKSMVHNLLFNYHNQLHIFIGMKNLIMH